MKECTRRPAGSEVKEGGLSDFKTGERGGRGRPKLVSVNVLVVRQRVLAIFPHRCEIEQVVAH